jgi:hypothetical protein
MQTEEGEKSTGNRMQSETIEKNDRARAARNSAFVEKVGFSGVTLNARPYFPHAQVC